MNTDNGLVDVDGDGCSEYKESWCGGEYDTPEFKADIMCCVCNGGQTPTERNNFNLDVKPKYSTFIL